MRGVVDFFLQLQQRIEKILGPWRATRYINIHGHDAIDALQNGVGVERPTHTRTGPHGDYPLRLWHLKVDSLQNGCHFQRYGSGDDHEVGLPGARSEHFRAEARNIEAGRSGGDHFNRAASQAKAKRPERRLSSPIEYIVHRRRQKITFKLILNEGHDARKSALSLPPGVKWYVFSVTLGFTAGRRGSPAVTSSAQSFPYGRPIPYVRAPLLLRPGGRRGRSAAG